MISVLHKYMYKSHFFAFNQALKDVFGTSINTNAQYQVQTSQELGTEDKENKRETYTVNGNYCK